MSGNVPARCLVAACFDPTVFREIALASVAGISRKAFKVSSIRGGLRCASHFPLCTSYTTMCCSKPSTLESLTFGGRDRGLTTLSFPITSINNEITR